MYRATIPNLRGLSMIQKRRRVLRGYVPGRRVLGFLPIDRVNEDVLNVPSPNLPNTDVTKFPTSAFPSILLNIPPAKVTYGGPGTVDPKTGLASTSTPFQQFSDWLAQDVVAGSGITKGAAVAGGGLLLTIALLKGRRN